jgi:trk system potassium uptake protein TrkA
LSGFDAVVIGVAENLEASVLATVLVKKIGVRHIVVKVGSPLHGEILRQVGATQTIDPETETASRVALSFAAPSVGAYVAVAAGFGAARLAVDGGPMAGKRLRQLTLVQSQRR